MLPDGAELGWAASYDLRQAQLDAIQVRLDLAKQQRAHQIAAAEAQLKQTLAAKAQTEAQLKEVSVQRLKLQNLQEAAAIADEDYQELASLQASDPELATDRQLRRQRNLSDRAKKEYEAAVASFPATLEAAEKSVEAAQANVTLAEQNVAAAKEVDETQAIEMERKVAEKSRELSVLKTPNVGGGSAQFTVLQILMEPGETIAQLPVVNVGDTSRMAVVTEVYEADVKEIADGQEVRISSPAFAGDFAQDSKGGGIPGTVTRIGTMIASPGLTNRNPLAPSDRSVVEVVVEIDPANAAATLEAAKRIGLQVTVEFGKKPSEPTAEQRGEK